jgi:hypothetical protein
MFHTLILLVIPAILLGGHPGKTQYVLTADIPDTIKGIQIRFEVRQVQVLYQGREVSVCCLCADITNKNGSPERILVRYQCQGKKKTKKIEIGGRQQRIILVDKFILTGELPSEIKKYYSLIGLEYRH